MSYVEIIEGGLQTTVQDTLLRTKWAHIGVAPGGAADVPAAEEANWLVGNRLYAALFEGTMTGPTLHFPEGGLIAVTGGDFSSSVDGAQLTNDVAVRLKNGSVLSFNGRRSGARIYVAIAGGLQTPIVLDSRSTDLSGGYGGFRGRPIRKGDVIELGPAASEVGRWIDRTGDSGGKRIRVLPGIHAGRAEFCRQMWTVVEANRQGIRLRGRPIRRGSADLETFPVTPGSIQLPPDGQPIILLVDAQPTGGYPVIGVVVAQDLPLLAQRAPGDDLRFATERLNALRSESLIGASFVDEFASIRLTGSLW